MNRRIVYLLAAVLAFVTSGVARAAEGRREAKAHADRALREYNLGNFDEAITEFGKAYEIEPSPILLFNIGLSHRHLEHWDRATFFFRRYLNETAPDAPSRAEAQRYVQEMESKIVEGKKGVDSTLAAKPAAAGPAASPAPTAVSNGAVAPPPPTITASPSGGPTAPPVGPGATPGTSAPANTNTPWLRTAAWISGGAAVVALAGGVAFQIASSSNLSDFNSGCGILNGSIVSKGTAQTQCVTFYDSWNSDKHWAIAGYAVGGAFAVTSAVLFLTSRPKSAETPVSFSCVPGPAAVACGGRF